MKTKAIALLRSAIKSDQAIKNERQCIQSYSEKHDIKILKYYIVNGVGITGNEGEPLKSISYDIKENIVCPSVLLVTTKSKLNHTLKVELETSTKLKAKEVEVIPVEKIGTECDVFFNSALSQIFSKVINESINRQRSKRIKAKQSELARDGYFPCGYIPFGYSLENSKRKSSHILRKKLVIHKEESKVVKKIFELASLKIPLNKNKALKISTELNENNIHCRGKRWTANKIINLLSNSTYLGEYVWGKKRDYNCKDNPPIKINVPAIITQNLFMQVNKK